MLKIVSRQQFDHNLANSHFMASLLPIEYSVVRHSMSVVTAACLFTASSITFIKLQNYSSSVLIPKQQQLQQQ